MCGVQWQEGSLSVQQLLQLVRHLPLQGGHRTIPGKIYPKEFLYKSFTASLEANAVPVKCFVKSVTENFLPCFECEELQKCL